jgi:hypothetical protein
LIFLLYCFNFHIILLLEVLKHIDLLTSVPLIKVVVFGVHVPSDPANPVRSLLSISGHDDSALKLSADGVLVLEPGVSFINQCKARFNRKELGDVIDDEIKTILEDP